LDNYVATCQIGITVSSLALGFYGQRALAARLLDFIVAHQWLPAMAAATAAAAAVLVVLTGIQILLGELVPKAVAIRYPERLALWATLPMRLSAQLLAPFIWAFNGTGTLVLRLFGLGKPSGHAHLHSPEEIEMLIAEAAGAGELDAAARQMLHNAFALSGLVARQVMIPRNRLVLADVETPTGELLAELARSPFSRIPVYRETPDSILGIVHLKDLFRVTVTGSGDVASIVRRVPMVPERLPVGQLWQILNQQQTYLAVVLGEHGGTAGIVTQEDLLEEIIGEVQDEFDVEAEPVIQREGSPPLVRGDLLVSDVNEAFGLGLPTDRADTVGGLLIDELGRLAQPDDAVELGPVRLRAVTVRGHWIERVAIEPLAQGDGDG
jgi:CBS domain containing-hemolysin-like protein